MTIFWSCAKLNRIQPSIKKISLGKIAAAKIFKKLDRLQNIK
jgi:hypothetical protein